MPEITLPTLHAGQVKVWQERTKRNLVRCGRRWGKTKMMVTLAADAAIKGGKVGLFAPEHKQLREPYMELLATLLPIKLKANQSDGTISLITGGRCDFWPLTDNPLAGRGREYDRVLGDEAAFTKNTQMMEIWERSISPTMATRPNADVWFFSTPNGRDPENFFYRLYEDRKIGFKDHHAPSISSPFVSAEYIEKERQERHPLVFEQEYEAKFVDFSGTAFFTEDKWLVDGRGVDPPARCDYVFAVIDTAVKDGIQHDGTAVTYFAGNQFGVHRLIVLDWDIIQIEAGFLETWLPTVFQRLEGLARECGARYGVNAAWIEDKYSGSTLLQRAMSNGWNVAALPSSFTAKSKAERALSVNGHHYQGLCKMTQHAHDKIATYKGIDANHLISQVCGFRVGGKPNPADDLLDTYVYGLAVYFNDSDGV